MTRTTLPTYFISHGGGPWPYMKREFGHTFDALEHSLQAIPAALGESPKAILVISGHWEDRVVRVMAHPNPPMVYDYVGFPAYTYAVHYKAPGAPELAHRIQGLLTEAGHEAALDPLQGFDHGAFTILSVMYPEADIPVVQLSLQRDYDPVLHWNLGQALAPLRDEQVLILGSGLSYHNLGAFGPEGAAASRIFDQWLQETLVHANPDERRRRLSRWTEAPGARDAHPRADHFLPLLVAAGAAQDEVARCVYHEEQFFGGLTVSSFQFGGQDV